MSSLHLGYSSWKDTGVQGERGSCEAHLSTPVLQDSQVITASSICFSGVPRS